MRRRAATLVELLVMGIILMLVLARAYQGFLSLKIGYEKSLDTNGSMGDSRQALESLSDHLRNAVRCTATSGCVTDSAISSGTATSVTYYDTSAGATVTYQLSGGNLVRTENGVDTIMIRRVSALAITYFTCTTYNDTAWTQTASASPTSTELPKLAAVRIVLTCQQNGTSSTTESMIRLRNSPKRGPLVGY